MARKQNGETRTRWREILDRQAASGLSIRSFCAAEDIREPSFYAWRKRLGFRETKVIRVVGRRATVQEAIGKTAGNNTGLFVPLKVIDGPSTLEIVHPLGYRIHMTGNVDPVALRHVLEALDERATR